MDFSRIFPGGAKSGEICFFLLKPKKQPLFAENFEIFPTPMLESLVDKGVRKGGWG